MKYKGKWGWIGSKMWVESFNFRTGTLGVLSVLAFFLILGIWNNTDLFVSRQKLEISQSLEDYIASSDGIAELMFEDAEILGECEIVKEKVDSLSFSLNGIFGEVPVGTSEYLTVYDVWMITGKDFKVLLCSEDNFDPEKRSVFVSRDVRMPNKDIADTFAPDTQVLFASTLESNIGTIAVWTAGLLAIIGVYLFIVRSSILLKRSKLAKQISKYGELKEMVNTLNTQAEDVHFECSKLAILKDWLLFMETDGMMVGTEKWYIQPVGLLSGIEVYQDEDDPEEFVAMLHYQDGRMSRKYHLNAVEAAQLKNSAANLII